MHYATDIVLLAVCYLAIASCFGASNLAVADMAQKPAPRSGAIDVTDKTAIQSAIPHEVVVAGTVSEIKDIQGAATINFNGTEKSQFYAVVLKRNQETIEKVHGEGLNSPEGKHIQITGKIVDCRKRPEII